MLILAIDLGFGDVKVASGRVSSDLDNIDKLFKYPSAVALTEPNPLVTDDRVLSIDGEHYYVAESALAMETSSIVDIKSYAHLEKFAPLFIHYTITKYLGEIPDIIVTGLSIAHIKHSAHFKARIEEHLAAAGIKAIVRIVPQGAIAKKAVDKYGMDFPNKETTLTSTKNYIGADLGFNTLDIFQVLNGETSSNLVRGLENKGIIVVAANLARYVTQEYQIKLTIKEAKDALDNKSFKRRGKTFDLTDKVNELLKDYLEFLNDTIEAEFGDVIDKMDFVALIGGGAYVFDEGDDFFKRPKSKAEYYNSIGYFEFAMERMLPDFSKNAE